MARERELHLPLLGNPGMGGGSWRLPGSGTTPPSAPILRLLFACST
jgi:hypothetical protein